jgi:hypothetical protein
MLLEQMYNEVQAIKNRNKELETSLQMLLLYTANNGGKLPALESVEQKVIAHQIHLKGVGFRFSLSGLQMIDAASLEPITSINHLPLI